MCHTHHAQTQPPPSPPPSLPRATAAALGAACLFLPTRSVQLLCPSRDAAVDAWTCALAMKAEWGWWGGVDVLLDAAWEAGASHRPASTHHHHRLVIKLDVVARAREVAENGGI